MSDGTAAVTPNRFAAAIHRAAAYTGYAMEMIAPLLPRLQRSDASSQTIVDGLTVRCHRAVPNDQSFSSAWESLYERSPDSTPFQSPAWQLSLLQTASAMRRLRLFAVYDRAASHLSAAAGSSPRTNPPHHRRDAHRLSRSAHRSRIHRNLLANDPARRAATGAWTIARS